MNVHGEFAPTPSWGKTSAWMRPFDELAVGDAHVSRGRTITEFDIVRFTGLSGEIHRTPGGHGDPAPPDGKAPAAPELLALTYSIGLIPNDYVRALRRISDLRVLDPIRCGDTIHVAAEIIRLERWTAQLGLVIGAWKIIKQSGAAAMTVELEAVWLRARR